MFDTVYVRYIDGTNTLTPVNARSIAETIYEILDDKQLNDDDPGLLFEFYPGDIVEVDDLTLDDYQYTAVKLLEMCQHPDRKYLLFKYKATLHKIPTSIESAIEYAEEIKRIKDEMAAGHFVYRGIRETIKYIDMAIQRSKI